MAACAAEWLTMNDDASVSPDRAKSGPRAFVLLVLLALLAA